MSDVSLQKPSPLPFFYSVSPTDIPYCSLFITVQLTVQMFIAAVYNERSGELF